MSEVDDLIAERDRIYAERSALYEELRPILRRLSELGVEDHPHGAATYASPMWWHAHPYDDGDHEHSKDEADAAIAAMHEAALEPIYAAIEREREHR